MIKKGNIFYKSVGMKDYRHKEKSKIKNNELCKNKKLAEHNQKTLNVNDNINSNLSM
ncbi:hypothetical protein [Clostridium beijerinckii]|uniref:hypothetical protein n=1 Tax=Clostridium beijerinckii TaxID=1520 RepID=UPI00157100C6|nr:hypothetical protein [Clostridium beijerinckii]NRT74434.1 hypothetical protein [Clostridium beijerinckii]